MKKQKLQHKKVFSTELFNRKSETGFTIIELVVVFAVSAIIFAVAASGYSSFSSKSNLENVAFDIALTIREAQAYGVGVKEVGLDQFNLAYGVYFNKITPNSYILFTDENNDRVYNNGNDTIINTYIIKNDSEINNLCVTTGVSVDCSISSLSIVFKRPNPGAIININKSIGTIKVKNKKTGNIKSIKITDTGQISVQ